MSNKNSKWLDHFVSWLIAAEHKSPLTAGVYAGYLAAAFRRPEVRAVIDDPKGLTESLRRYESALAGTTRGPLRAALRAFGRYARSRGARFEPGLGRQAAIDPVIGSIRELLECIPAARVPRLTWGEVYSGMAGEHGIVTDPGFRGRTYEVPTGVIQALYRWGLPPGFTGSPRSRPLVPSAPGATTPMSAYRLRKLVG